jgi:hypothetical protein
MATDIDLTHAIVIVPAGAAGAGKAVAMLVEEVHRRTQIRWTVSGAWPEKGVPVIAVGPEGAHADSVGRYGQEMARDGGVPGPEGYRIRSLTGGAAPAVLVIGNDARGMLFGVGRLLRTLRMERGSVRLPDDTHIATAPRFPLRGHQLGYRPKTNSYDAWSLPMWEQYIRDLAVFGTNAVELIPPRSDDDADSPHFPLPPMEMMVGMSQLLADYDLDVWIWYPAMDEDYADPKTVDRAVQEWGEVFRQLPRIDAVFVPGGDPGHTPPPNLMALLERQAQALQRYHPHAGMWVSPQGFNEEWLDLFLEILHRDRPAWLSGVVYGPQIRMTLPELRAALPAEYPIRRYPDITHSRHCQYPVPDWDPAYARTEGREGINPRPLGQARIFRAYQGLAVGFITYSEGCNDDVNKFVWSALGWDPDADVVELLREYGRYFIADGLADNFAQGLLALERNWQGPLLSNEGVLTTLAQFQEMERSASPQMRMNWRFQQALYRAYYDAYTRSRLLYETCLEERATERLREAGRIGSLKAMNEAETLLDRAVTQPVAGQWRARVFELAEALFQSIRMQLSVDRYAAIAVERGANLDSIDVPLNDRAWLKGRFADLRQLPEEQERLRGIEEIVRRTDPGPGGFYDDLGNPSRQPHLVRGAGFEQDPAFRESALLGISGAAARPLSASRHALALYEAPLTMHYPCLDRSVRYRLRVVSDLSPRRKLRLVANDSLEIHPYLGWETPAAALEFDLPAEATAGGELTLRWYGEPGLGGNGRGCQVAEVWLMKVAN